MQHIHVPFSSSASSEGSGDILSLKVGKLIAPFNYNILFVRARADNTLIVSVTNLSIYFL